VQKLLATPISLVLKYIPLKTEKGKNIAVQKCIPLKAENRAHNFSKPEHS
jgi:hypothetical protein